MRTPCDLLLSNAHVLTMDERFTVLVSSAFGEAKPVDLVNWLLAANLPRVRVQLQMHKYIWDPNARGV